MRRAMFKNQLDYPFEKTNGNHNAVNKNNNDNGFGDVVDLCNGKEK